MKSLPSRLREAVAATHVDLTASFDGTASADTDGTVASWAWSFGDGTTGTGSTVSHAYSSAGTCPVTLTVTDNRGGTGTTAQSGTTTNPPASGATIAADAFARTLSAGWGTADSGGAWAISGAVRRQRSTAPSGRCRPPGKTETARLSVVVNRCPASSSATAAIGVRVDNLTVGTS